MRDSRETDEVLVCMAQRLQGQVERQLTLVERLHEASTDETLADLAELRTTLQRSLRGIENLLVLSGAQQGPRSRGPRPVAEVLADARVGVDDAARVELGTAPDVSVAPRAVSGLVALFTELLNHALTVAPGLSTVEVTSRRSEDGGVLVEVATDGPGPTPGELDELNRRLADRPIIDDIVSDRVGLFVAARIAARSGVTVRVQHRRVSGHVAVVHCPPDVLDSVGVDGPRTWDRGGFGNGYGTGYGNGYPHGGNGSPVNGLANGRGGNGYGPNGSGANGYGANGHGGYGDNGHGDNGFGDNGFGANSSPGNGSAWTPPAREDDPLRGSRPDDPVTSSGGYASAASPTGDFPLPDLPADGTGGYDAVGGTGGYRAAGDTGGYDAVRGTGGYGAVAGSGAFDAAGGSGSHDAAGGSGSHDAAGGSGSHDTIGGSGVFDATGGSGSSDAVGGSGTYDAVGGSGVFDARSPGSAQRPAGGRSPEAYDRNGLPVRRRPDPLVDPLPSAFAPPSYPPPSYPPPSYAPPPYAPPAPGRTGSAGYDEADVLFGPLSSSLRDQMRESGPSPIYEAVASAWFIEGHDAASGAPADWSSPSDAEWRAATERAARPAVEQYQSTAAGLPRRRPGTQMVAPPRQGPPPPAAAGPRDREPERVRERLAVYQQGLERGRHRAADGE